MKRQKIFAAFLIAALLAITPLNALAAETGLSSAEESMLLFMREEEKLARDVYDVLYIEHGTSIFDNISRAEQKHMDSMKVLLDTYGLADPVINDATGAFVNAELATLYNELVYDGNALGAAGLDSLEAALLVGALIEEVDIEDIVLAIQEADHADIIQTYEQLLNGSYNHLRAFVGQWEKITGESYAARILDSTMLNDILSGNTPSTMLDQSIVVNLEEPANNETKTGVANLRGWAVGPSGIATVQLYIDGEHKASIPYGGVRGDVGDMYPEFPDANESGFSMIWNYSRPDDVAVTYTVRAIAPDGRYNEVSSTVNHIMFHKNFFNNPEDIDVSTSTVSQDDDGIIIQGLSVEGQRYDVRLEWHKASQDFNIIGIE